MNHRLLGRLLSILVLVTVVFMAQGWARTRQKKAVAKKPAASTATKPAPSTSAAAKKTTTTARKPATTAAKSATASKPAAKATKSATASKPAATATKVAAKKPTTAAKKTTVRRTTTRRTAARRRARVEPPNSTAYADSSAGDDPSGDDPVVRMAALHALGPLNGSIVVVNPTNGRILSMVNQQAALGRAYTPCSTIKMPVTLAALQEGVVNPAVPVRLTRRWSLTLTDALAHSNNQFFEKLGSTLGFQRLSKYERDFGFGELAGYNIPGETLGSFPDEPPSTGVAHMSSFGNPISVTPLQLAAFVSAVANGGTLYFLQYPRTLAEQEAFQPRIKRELDVREYLQPLREGMIAAVLRGTARNLENPYDQVLGKTGTCSDGGTRLGWFASYESPDNPKLAVVVLLRGGRTTAGSGAAGVAGRVYRYLHETNYYATVAQQPETRGGSSITTPAAAIFNPLK